MRFIARRTLMLMVVMLAIWAPEAVVAFPSHGLQQAGGSHQSAGADDPVEQKALAAALRQADPKVKASQLESFLTRYPTSIHRKKAWASLLQTCEKLGDFTKLDVTASRLLEEDPNNLVGLWTKARLFLLRHRDPKDFQDIFEIAKRGLRILNETNKANETSLAQDERSAAMFADFNQAAGSIALELNDFEAAQHYLRACVELRPDRWGIVYGLSLAYLKASPPDPAQGLFFFARAVNLTQPRDRERFDAFGKQQCIKYYDSDRMWPALKDLAKTHSTPPPGFRIPQ